MKRKILLLVIFAFVMLLGAFAQESPVGDSPPVVKPVVVIEKLTDAEAAELERFQRRMKELEEPVQQAYSLINEYNASRNGYWATYWKAFADRPDKVSSKKHEINLAVKGFVEKGEKVAK